MRKKKYDYLFSTTFVAFCLMATCGALSLLSSCNDSSEASGEGTPTGELRQVRMSFNSGLMLSPASLNSGLSATKAGGKEAVEVQIGGGNDVEVSAPPTRASLSETQENAVNELTLFQFDGTGSTSKLVYQSYVSGITGNSAALSLLAGTGQTVYVVANAGDLTTKFTVNSTQLSAFQTSVLNLAEGAVTAGNDLPLSGYYTGSTNVSTVPVSLTRMAARVNFTCNLSLPAGDSFTFASIQMKSVPNVAQIAPAASPYPANATSDASKYVDYTAVTSYTAGTTLTWYMPENLRGTNAAITGSWQKSPANAPAYSTVIVVSGSYTPSGGTAKDVSCFIYPGADAITNFNVLRNYKYGISITLKGINALDGRVVVGGLGDNLSATETANCYIVTQGNKNYKFNAKVMGNGATTAAVAAQAGSAITPTTLAPTTAFLVWETGAKGNVIQDGSITLANGYVTFKTANNVTPGNAVIAVSDGTNILWSWHIWKVNYNPSTDYATYKKYGSATTFKMMKYNLGATEISNWSGTATNAGDLGLYYQWGRKDPFVGGQLWAATSRIVTYNAAGYSWLDGTGSTAVANATAGTNAATSIAYSIKNPTHFIIRNASSNDWLNVSANSGQRDNLWGNPNTGTAPNTLAGSKSIYDPCPPGWRVPTQDSYQIFSTTGTGTTPNVSGAWANGYNFYIAATSGVSSFWPASGARTSTTGALSNVGSYGVYWSSSSFGTGSPMIAGYLSFSSGYVSPLYGDSRATGCPVRCAQY